MMEQNAQYFFLRSKLSKSFKQYTYAYFVSLILITYMFFQHAMPFYWYLFGVVEVCAFFYFSKLLLYKWKVRNKMFEHNLFVCSFLIRIIYVIFIFWFFYFMTDSHFEFNAADSIFYDQGGKIGSSLLRQSIFDFIQKYDRQLGADLSDTGFPVVVSIVYWLTNDSLFAVLIFNVLVSSFTVVFMYRYAYRTFGMFVGRLTGLMIMLMPNLIYYCGVLLKESLMLFLVVLFIERTDNLIRNGKFAFWQILLVVIIGFSLFTFRTILGVVLFLAFLMSILFTNNKIIGWNRKLLIGVLAFGFFAFFVGNQIKEDVNAIINTDIEAQQEINMKWRSERNDKNGTANIYAKYASAIVFAPLIFAIPFPTMVDIPLQEKQLMIHGGCYIKSVLSFLLVFALIWLLRKREWRNYVLPISVLAGYLFILVFSSFAQSERFHIPIVPLELMFSAYGLVCIFNSKYTKLNQYWLYVIVFICIFWNFFKLSGHNLI